MQKKKILSLAKQVIRIEADGIALLESFLDNNFEQVVQEIYHCSGKIIITGIGKSAHIAQKIVATFNSTGTPAIFLHAAEAVHGDLGIIQRNDIIIAISKSGNTPEIKNLTNILSNIDVTLVAIVSEKESYLAQHAKYIIHAPVKEEACPNKLAPTTSTTVQLVIGDALASCLIDLRGFTESDFAKFHPGGSLGKKLHYKVETLMNTTPPKVSPTTPMKDVILEISSKRMGATAVVDSDSHLLGIITDGDIRRMLEHEEPFSHLTAKDIMTKTSKFIGKDMLASSALHIMEKYSITQLPVIENDTYIGLIHLHDILREGIS
jgi:arabinose-5-phosphate isomerase